MKAHRHEEEPDGHEGERESPALSRQENREVEQRQALPAPVVYEIVRRTGETELERPKSSLWWSGIAAGLGISSSVVAEGLLHLHLPDNAWRPVLENFGYCLGFVIVVIGRLQLFTENTITVILPLLAHRTLRNLVRTARLWSIVFSANMTGCLIAATLLAYGVIATPEQQEAFLAVSAHLTEKGPLATLLHGIPAGFFIAVMVWMMPSARGSEIWVITAITFVIALGGYAHVVAGSTEIFYLALLGQVTFLDAIGGFILPALVGNVIGGTGLFALLAYAQVSHEMEEEQEKEEREAPR